MKKIALLLTFFTTYLFAVTFNEIPVALNSKGLKIGDEAPVFHGVDIDLQDVVVGGKKDKVQVIAFVPSLDTGTCRLEALAFNNKIEKMPNVELTLVSKDLPFSLERFCKTNAITNIQTISDYKDDNNVLLYGVTISSPAFLEKLFARVVYIVDTNGKIVYKQVVEQMSMEPDYDDILEALKRIK